MARGSSQSGTKKETGQTLRERSEVKIKVGDIVEILPHVDFDVTKTIFTEPVTGMVQGICAGTGEYYDVLLQSNGRIVFVSARNLATISESR